MVIVFAGVWTPIGTFCRIVNIFYSWNENVLLVWLCEKPFSHHEEIPDYRDLAIRGYPCKGGANSWLIPSCNLGSRHLFSSAAPA